MHGGVGGQRREPLPTRFEIIMKGAAKPHRGDISKKCIRKKCSAAPMGLDKKQWYKYTIISPQRGFEHRLQNDLYQITLKLIR
jgi:hypothetical protein